jgi:hypothetical protein
MPMSRLFITFLNIAWYLHIIHNVNKITNAEKTRKYGKRIISNIGSYTQVNEKRKVRALLRCQKPLCSSRNEWPFI